MMTRSATAIEVGASPNDLQEYFLERGWTDGLPIIAPTPELVASFVAASGLGPLDEVASIAPSQVVATVEKVAINAAMAGCRPDYMPVVLAALRAIARPEFNLAGVQGTTHPAAPLIFVNGPVRERLGINCGSSVFGQGTRANATIGRAVRLVLMNIGQGLPGRTDMATFGSPAKFTYCAGENEERNPWEPYHVEHGMRRDESAVLAHAGEAPHNVQDHASRTPDELIMTIADTMNTTGNNNAGLGGEMMVVLGPEHATILASHGMSKEDVRQALHRRLRFQFDRWGSGLRAWYRIRRPPTNLGPEITEIPYLDDPKQILILVAGGPGLHSTVIPSFGGMSKSTIERIVFPG